MSRLLLLLVLVLSSPDVESDTRASTTDAEQTQLWRQHSGILPEQLGNLRLPDSSFAFGACCASCSRPQVARNRSTFSGRALVVAPGLVTRLVVALATVLSGKEAEHRAMDGTSFSDALGADQSDSAGCREVVLDMLMGVTAGDRS